MAETQPDNFGLCISPPTSFSPWESRDTGMPGSSEKVMAPRKRGSGELRKSVTDELFAQITQHMREITFYKELVKIARWVLLWHGRHSSISFAPLANTCYEAAKWFRGKHLPYGSWVKTSSSSSRKVLECEIELIVNGYERQPKKRKVTDSTVSRGSLSSLGSRDAQRSRLYWLLNMPD